MKEIVRYIFSFESFLCSSNDVEYEDLNIDEAVNEIVECLSLTLV